MRPAHRWPSALVLITLLTLLPTTKATTYTPGVQPGDWAKYGNISATWQSNIPGYPGSPPDPIALFLVTQSILIAVTDVSGTNVTISGTVNYTNGTSSTEIFSGDVTTGDLSFWILSAGLNPGDPIYPTAWAPTINYTTTQTFAGVQREAVVLDINSTSVNLAGSVHTTVLGLWDRNTGILLQLSGTVFYDYSGQTASGTVMATLTETNLWYEGTPHFTISARPPSLEFNLAANGTAFASSTLFLSSVGNFSGEIFLSTHITPYLVNGLTVEAYTETVRIFPGSTATSTLRVFAAPDTPPGTYLVNVTATDSTQSHTVLIPVTIDPVAEPDFALTIAPDILYVRSGLYNITGVYLTSLEDFSGTVQLAVDVLIGNITDTGFSVSWDPQSVTVVPGSIATSTITVSAGTNATGSIGLLVTGTSDNLTHQATLTVVIEPGGPSNLPPVPSISAPSVAFVGIPVSFSGLGSYDPDGFVQYYNWDFGDGYGGFGPLAGHTYSSPGVYTVTLTVIDNLGATGTTAMQLQVLQPPTHDVAVVDILLSQTVVVSGQYVNVLVILQNRGVQAETVSLAVYADTMVIASLSNIVLDNSDPFAGYVSLTGDTEGLAPGDYGVSATVFLATDENLFDNTLLDGQLTVLPPPVITVTPDSGSLGTRITVQGSGFPPRPSGYGPVPVLVSFDDQFIGFAIPEDGGFEFTFNIPHAQPGPREVKAADTFSGVQATTSFTVTEGPGLQSGPQLEVRVEAGVIYFPGETAVVNIQTTLNGVPTSPDGPITITLYKPDGSAQQLTPTMLGNGIYRAQYAVPRTVSLGTYLVVVTAGHNGSSASGMVSFEVKPTWIAANGPRLATASAAITGIVLVVGLSWRRGCLRKRTETQLD